MAGWDPLSGEVPKLGGGALRGRWSLLPWQELERLEVERVEMIRQHLCQYTQLRHETDMFNQSVSPYPQAEASRILRGKGPGATTRHYAVAV